MRAILKADTLPATDAVEAAAILRACVHCGFCNATCPSYQVLGDERDGPRGRIYLMKSMLEGGEVTMTTQQHLDRCLGCKACETTCPSGVKYTRLLDLVRPTVEARVPRTLSSRILRWGLRQVIPHPVRFKFVLWLGRITRPLLPRALRDMLPTPRTLRVTPQQIEAKKHYALLEGCVQEPTMPSINQAARVILNANGVALAARAGSGCCGALPLHLGAEDEARACARRNVDAWFPLLEKNEIAGVVSASSGCTQVLKEYPHLLRHDAEYRERAARVAAAVRDPSEVIAPADIAPYIDASLPREKIALQTPCSLQHGLKAHAQVEALLHAAGYELGFVADAHLCCGSAGAYSLLQPQIAETLRARKVESLQRGRPAKIATANIGCMLYLESAAKLPVRHWLELIAARFK